MTPSRPSLSALRNLLAFVLLLGTAALTACPKEQGASSESGEQEAPQPASRYRGHSATFVNSLCSLKVFAYTVSDEGAAVVYDELSFDEDGSFEASTSIRIGDEPFSCRESGTWAMDSDAADDRNTAALTLEVTSTDCAGRSAPDSFRVRARIADNEIELSHI